jgi:hypothetical protein
MRTPPLLLAAGAAFWGWRSGNYVIAGSLALALEAHRVAALRFAFGAKEFTRFASVSTVALLGLVGWLLAESSDALGPGVVLKTFLWLPVVFAPVMLAQLYSVGGRLPLSALSRHLRRIKENDASLGDPLVDLSMPYFAICVIAAGTVNAASPTHYAAAALVAAWALYATRPRAVVFALWIGLLAIAAAGGYGVQLGLFHAQGALGDWVGEWRLHGIAADAYRSVNELGTIGRLKQFDSIIMRVYAAPANVARLKLLHRASFNTLTGNSWLARNAPMISMQPDPGATWRLAPGRADWSARFVTRLESGKALLALPAGVVRVSGLPADSWRRNALGASSVDIGGDWAEYTAEAVDSIRDYAAPWADDLTIPAAERAELERVAAQLGIKGVSADEALRRVRDYLATFSYSTYRDTAVPAGSTAVGDFLLRTKSGHCEYFAAATTLLLRAAGVPARYATGYAVLEYSALEKAYLVRARHAHAWARAWIDGRWIDVDTTPPSWFDEESNHMPFWESAADFLRWASFRWSQRGELRIGAAGYALIALLSAFLVWRLLRGRRAARSSAVSDLPAFRGSDSEFYAVERMLARKGLFRQPSESLLSWIERHGLTEQLGAALALHYRYRFDPDGLSALERSTLRSTCLGIVDAWHRSDAGH